ncbi:flagellar basal body L-ring protein FlgH [Simiduia curdlanivorans]|uniref:Flagellar L-ring protein n=1 Tax=Simiduia curdlanivorans TaxID=1492769 RepID=A0ABV8V397_9GAMM|nr:flagellar basal body L-ring protein FlgH [Simiduia curdlanivorans]MDN3639957.1 flagellar basal body L-ring protein FlgH [Simiduia curdlanivorans]
MMLQRLMIISFFAAGLVGCVVATPPSPNDPFYAPVMTNAPMPTAPTNGSLYRGDYSMSFFDDRKATRVGDIITIVLDERTTGSKKSGVSVKKESDNSFTGSILGVTPRIGEHTLDTETQLDRDFNGESDADQSNSLQGNITATVTDVLPNGNLIIRGEKWITLNQGEEFIRVSGMVRREDINLDNSIQSTRLANARLSYAGKGPLADSGQMGWLAQFFNSPVWPL